MTTLSRFRRLITLGERVDTHLHARERWLGKSADQSGSNWAADSLTAFRAVSGDGGYGGDADDEAKVLGSADTPIQAGCVKFDLGRLLVCDVSSSTPWKIRLVCGTGTMAAAVAAGDFTEAMVKFDAMAPVVTAAVPVPVMLGREDAGSKVWIQAKNATDNATIDFFVGLHEYDE